MTKAEIFKDDMSLEVAEDLAIEQGILAGRLTWCASKCGTIIDLEVDNYKEVGGCIYCRDCVYRSDGGE